MGHSNTFYALGRAKDRKLKKTIKKLKKTKFHRYKKDHWVIRQHEIFQTLNDLFPDVHKDFWKSKKWWDFVLEKHKIVISIVASATKPNVLANNRMKQLGWNVLTISYSDTNLSSIQKLCKDIGFIISKPEFLADRAKELNNNLPKSERWFKEKIRQEWFFKKMKFSFNKDMFGAFIYDLFSEKYRLCIEVDGSIHDTPTQKEKDLFKTNMTQSKGFNIIRVQAFNEESYSAAMLLINQLIENYGAKYYKLEQQEVFNNKIKELEESGKLPF